MKIFSVILLISLLTISLLSCAVNNNSSAGSDDENNSPVDTTTVSGEPTPDPDPVIDMEELYRKVFENQSKCYSREEAPDLEDLDQNTDPMIVYLVAFDPEPHILDDRIWVVEGVTSDFANGLLEKYKISTYNYTASFPKYYNVQGYYHSAYLDVLFENVTFEAIDNLQSEFDLTRIAAINGDEDHPDRYYYACEDMKLYFEEDGVAYRSVQNVDSAYLHMMAHHYIHQDLYLPSATPGAIMVYNIDPEEEGVPKKVYRETSDGEIVEYSIYPSGRVYSQIYEEYSEFNQNSRIGVYYWGKYHAYFPTEELFRATYGDQIKE